MKQIITSGDELEIYEQLLRDKEPVEQGIYKIDIEDIYNKFHDIEKRLQKLEKKD